MRAIIAIILLLLGCSHVFASQDHIQQPQSVTITFAPDQRVVLEIASDTVIAITVELGESTFRVPAATCAKISSVRFDTVRLLWDGRSGTPLKAAFFYLRFTAGAEATRAFGKLPEMTLMFNDRQFTWAHIAKMIDAVTLGSQDL